MQRNDTPNRPLGGFITGLLLFCTALDVQAGAVVGDGWRMGLRYGAHFTAPPTGTPSKTAVDGPLLGNGDLGVTLSGPPESQRFWIAKNDFWRFKSQYGTSGPRLFGGIDIGIPALEGADYRVEQAFDNAVTTGRFSARGTTVTMKSWVAATENIFVVELTSKGGLAKVDVAPFVGVGDGSQAQSDRKNSLHLLTREFAEDVDIPVGAACAVKLIGADGLSFTLEPGRTVTVACVVKSSFDSDTYKKDVLVQAGALNASKLDELRRDHGAWWREYWGTSRVEIGDRLIEQRYYLSHYVMGSCSRNPEFPPPIFGTWNTTDEPGWFGDYHLNYNHMAPFYALYSSNRIQQADPYHAPILDFMERGKWYAKQALNCRGLFYPVGIGPKGIETTRNAARHADWHKKEGGLFFGQKSNAAYCVVNIAMRWYHTYENAYAEKLYPFVREVADFWEDYLKLEDGRYVIYDDAIHEGSGDGGDFNPILSLGLVRNVFELATDMSVALEMDTQRRIKWNDILDRLSDFPTQEKDGKIVFRYTEKGTPWWPDNTLGIQHIYPAGAIGLDSPPALLETARNTIQVMDRWIDNNGMNSFFPAAVRVGYDPEIVLAKLSAMIKQIGQTNGFIKGNPHGIENCSIVPNTINEMLCMSHGHVLRLFPVWPSDRDARFRNLRAVGAFLVDSELRNGRVRYVRIMSEQGRNCTVQNPWPGEKVLVVRNRVEAETVGGTRFTLLTQKNQEIILTPADKPGE